jgi:hypothetical protein
MLSSSSVDQTRDALEAVLKAQAELESREEKRRQPKNRGRHAGFAGALLAALSLWLLISPPEAIQPPPVPARSPEAVGIGLRMDIYFAAAQVLSYRDTRGELPRTLLEAVAEPESVQGLTYLPGSAGIFDITGERGGQVVVYRSTDSLEEFLERAREPEGSGTPTANP